MLGLMAYAQRYVDRVRRGKHRTLRALLLAAGACMLGVAYLTDSALAYGGAMGCVFLVIGADLVALARGTDQP